MARGECSTQMVFLGDLNGRRVNAGRYVLVKLAIDARLASSESTSFPSQQSRGADTENSSFPSQQSENTSFSSQQSLDADTEDTSFPSQQSLGLDTEDTSFPSQQSPGAATKDTSFPSQQLLAADMEPGQLSHKQSVSQPSEYCSSPPRASLSIIVALDGYRIASRTDAKQRWMKKQDSRRARNKVCTPELMLRRRDLIIQPNPATTRSEAFLTELKLRVHSHHAPYEVPVLIVPHPVAHHDTSAAVSDRVA